MTQQTHLVTGATDGIGLETALALAERGARVLVHGRSEEKARAAQQAIQQRLPSAQLIPVWGDFSQLAQVRALAQQVLANTKSLDVLINNAGVFSNEPRKSAEGHELTFAVNHLAPFALTHLVMGAIKAAPQGRIVTVSSIAHARGKVDLAKLGDVTDYDGYAAYAATKLMNVYFTHELARRLAATAVTAYAIHPGVISTKLLKAGFSMSGGSAASGARTSVFCATAPELAKRSGLYFANGEETAVAPQANDPGLERELYEKSCKLAGVAL
jgi:NAD(P)-dependent dehydrogenase (short-subunit alcohol dehydrogenase family)